MKFQDRITLLALFYVKLILFVFIHYWFHPRRFRPHGLFRKFASTIPLFRQIVKFFINRGRCLVIWEWRTSNLRYDESGRSEELKVLEVGYGWRIGYGVRRIFWLADTATFDENVILTSERHGTQRNNQKKIGNIRLRALAVDDIAFLRSVIQRTYKYFKIQLKIYIHYDCTFLTLKINLSNVVLHHYFFLWAS